jgi:peptidoglycan/xylan/chitin deacetylase (PgdA/CDA1 family)
MLRKLKFFSFIILFFAGTMNLTAASRPRIAISLDDPNTSDTPLLDWNTRNENILSALKKHNLQAAIFVCGMRVDDENGLILLKRLDEAGHLICNHSYSHLYFNSNKIELSAYVYDFYKGDSVISKFSNFTKLYRFPYLKEGNTIEKRDGFRKILNDEGYKNGYVSIDASDWYVDQRLREKLKIDLDADLTPYKNFYLGHMYERTMYYDNLAREITGRQIDHVILMHHNLLNALFLDDLIQMFEEKGWQIINISRAYKDSVYSEMPEILPAGESIVWALAKQTGKYDNELRYPGEDSEYEKDKMDKLGL